MQQVNRAIEYAGIRMDRPSQLNKKIPVAKTGMRKSALSGSGRFPPPFREVVEKTIPQAVDLTYAVQTGLFVCTINYSCATVPDSHRFRFPPAHPGARRLEDAMKLIALYAPPANPSSDGFAVRQPSPGRRSAGWRAASEKLPAAKSQSKPGTRRLQSARGWRCTPRSR